MALWVSCFQDEGMSAYQRPKGDTEVILEPWGAHVEVILVGLFG